MELDCQRAKQRYYYRARQSGAAKSRIEEAEEQQRLKALRESQMAGFVRAALEDARVDCAVCDRTDVVPGYAHPNPEWNAACEALMTRELPQGVGWLMKAVYPR
jgi:hypothetical protein